MNGFLRASADEFLHLCLRGRWDEAALEAAQGLSRRDGFAWDAVHEAVQREDIAPLLYAIARGRGLLPAAIEEEWRMAYFANARRNLLLFHELAHVLRALAAHGIPTLVLKGVALAEAVYGNPAVRPMGDADVLVQCEDVPCALRVLSALGYAAPHGEARVGDTLAYENEVMLCKPGAQESMLEIHWSLFDSPSYQYNLALDWFWETATPLRLEDVTTQMFGPEAQLLHLCGHVMLHHGSASPRLLWLHDIAEVLVAYQTLDWASLLRQAQTCNLTLPVRQLLPRVIEEWCLPIPNAVLTSLRALEPSPQEARLFADLTAPHRPVIRRFWGDLASMPDGKTRLKYAWHSMVPSVEYMRMRYAIPRAWLTPLYYPYRWWVGIKTSLQKVDTR